MPISAFAPKSGHTFYYIRKQICTDIPRGIPIFSCPIIGTQIVTHLGISHLFVALRSAHHWGHFLGHPYFFADLQLVHKQWHPLGYPYIFVIIPKEHFWLHPTHLPSFLQTNYRDTFWDISSISQTKNQLRSEIILKPEPVLKKYIKFPRCSLRRQPPFLCPP